MEVDLRRLVPADVVSLHAAIDRLVKERNGNPERDHITRVVQREIRKLALIASSLRDHLNEASLIWDVPDEVLLLVFKEAATSYDHDRLRTILCISQVCHRWRIISLDCSVLWNTLTERDTNWIPIILERCQAAPLRVSWNAPNISLKTPENSIVPLKRVLERLDQIGTCSLYLSKDELSELESLFQTASSSLLETFNIGLEPVPNPEMPTDLYWTPSQLDQPFLPNSPLLRSVHVGDIRLSWSRQAQAWPSLTSLIIEHTYPPEELLSLEEILDILTTLSQLQSLELHSILGPLRSLRGNFAADVNGLLVDPMTPLTVRRLQVTNLREFTADMSDSESVVEIFRHIEFPSECTVEIEAVPDDDNPVPVPTTLTDDLVTPAALILALRRPIAWKGVRIDGYRYGKFSLSLCAYGESGTESHVHFYDMVEELYQSLISFSSIANLPNIVHIQNLEVRIPLDESQWRAVCCAFRNVSSLTVGNEKALTSLAEGLVGNGLLDFRSTLFPKLEELNVVSACGVRNELQECLASALTQRASKGLKLKTLRIESARPRVGDSPINWEKAAEEVHVDPSLLGTIGQMTDKLQREVAMEFEEAAAEVAEATSRESGAAAGEDEEEEPEEAEADPTLAADVD